MAVRCSAMPTSCKYEFSAWALAALILYIFYVEKVIVSIVFRHFVPYLPASVLNDTACFIRLFMESLTPSWHLEFGKGSIRNLAFARKDLMPIHAWYNGTNDIVHLSSNLQTCILQWIVSIIG
jgi:hypothetical protein